MNHQKEKKNHNFPVCNKNCNVKYIYLFMCSITNIDGGKPIIYRQKERHVVYSI